MCHSTVTVKICSACRVSKPLDNFTTSMSRCKTCRAADARERYRKNPTKVRAINTKWEAANADRMRKYRAAYMRSRAQTDVNFALTKRMRHRLWKALRGQGSWTECQTLLGYTVEDLRRHLESQFQEGMSWDNFGEWHIDHVVPLCSFHNLADMEEEFIEAWSLNNLQPLWAVDNLRKGGKVCSTVPLP